MNIVPVDSFPTPRDEYAVDSDYSHPDVYYGERQRIGLRSRAFSEPVKYRPYLPARATIRRRLSHDETPSHPREFLIPVLPTLERLLASEDTNHDSKITVEDTGPKSFRVGTENSGGHRTFELRGTYTLSVLLQELTFAKTYEKTFVYIGEARLQERPTNRLKRYVRIMFWPNLTRSIQSHNLAKMTDDPKDWTKKPTPRLYVHKSEREQFEYFRRKAAENRGEHVEVVQLEKNADHPDYVEKLNDAPGLLLLATEKRTNPNTHEVEFVGLPYCVPGGRFNEMYGWDSYFISLGLLANNEVHLAKSMALNFAYMIKRYGKIPNANRTYYLGRSQPPFMTDMALQVYERIKHERDALDFLRETISAAIKEYYTVWTSEPRLDPETKLSRYHPTGRGFPPETEPSHYDHLLKPYMEKFGFTKEQLVEYYNKGILRLPEIDEFLLHDRGVRESGHDTSFRIEGVCAYLATVDLNSLLYKYETDIEKVIRTYFNDNLEISDEHFVPNTRMTRVETSGVWLKRSIERKAQIDKYLWNEAKSTYFDYNTKTKKQSDYESATMIWPLWAGAASSQQAQKVVSRGLPLVELAGGVVSGSKRSLARDDPKHPKRQWDYPVGWPPHQIMAIIALIRYGFHSEARRLAFRWCSTVIETFIDFNGALVEKYNVNGVGIPSKVDAEYGNQGMKFKFIASEGFGWNNASFLICMQVMSEHMERAVNSRVSWDSFAKAVKSY